MQLLPTYRCKYTAKADIKSRGLYNFCEISLVFEGPEARDRIRNKRDIEIMTNACFSALNHAEGLMKVEQRIELKTSQVVSTESRQL